MKQLGEPLRQVRTLSGNTISVQPRVHTTAIELLVESNKANAKAHVKNKPSKLLGTESFTERKQQSWSCVIL